MTTTDKFCTVVDRTLVQPILNVAWLSEETCMQGTVNTERANEKGEIRLECASAVHLMRNKGKTVIDEWLHRGGVVEGDGDVL